MKPSCERFRSFVRRRRYVVNERIQSPIVFMSIRHTIFVLALTAAFLFLPLLSGLGTDPRTASREAVEKASHLLYLHSRYWWVACLALLVIAFDAIRISHRIAGPLYRMRKTIDEASAGRMPRPIRLRRGDYLHEEVESLNRLFEYAESLRVQLQDAMRRLGDSVGRCRSAIESRNDDELQLQIDRLVSEKNQLDDLIEQVASQVGPREASTAAEETVS